MLLQNTIKQSFKNLRSQKMRSFLTMLGIIIGIFSVIVVTSVIAGAESLIVNQINSIGSNIIGVLPGKSEENGPPAAIMGVVITTLKDSDTEAVKERIPGIAAASSYVSLTESVSWSNETTVPQVYGVSADYPKITDAQLAQGHFFTEDQKRTNSNVAILGSQVVEDLFKDQDPVGEKIKIRQQSFVVIGVMEPQGTSGFQNVDNMVFLPVTTVQKKLLGINHIGFMRIRAETEDDLPYLINEIEELLRTRHNIKDATKDDFTVSSPNEALEMLGTITQSLRIFLVAIVSISLIVGGIGIMNIMLAAVNQRIQEIGLRKAVGATKKHIISQFLLETVVLTFSSAIIGIILGILFSLVIAVIMKQIGYQWDFVVTLTSILVACLSAIVIGLIFGLYPAQKAAKLDPITALRYE